MRSAPRTTRRSKWRRRTLGRQRPNPHHHIWPDRRYPGQNAYKFTDSKSGGGNFFERPSSRGNTFGVQVVVLHILFPGLALELQTLCLQPWFLLSLLLGFGSFPLGGSYRFRDLLCFFFRKDRQVHHRRRGGAAGTSSAGAGNSAVHAAPVTTT